MGALEQSDMALKKKKEVQYIDFGYESAEQFWAELVLPAYERFQSTPNRQSAIEASVPAWHVHGWIWHQQHRGETTENNQEFQKFRTEMIEKCCELAWVRDVANASKHRGLTRPKKVQRVERKVRVVGPLNTYALNTMPLNSMSSIASLNIVLNEGTTHGFAEALSHVINYWRDNFFPATE
jgi:hypothetical protein